MTTYSGLCGLVVLVCSSLLFSVQAQERPCEPALCLYYGYSPLVGRERAQRMMAEVERHLDQRMSVPVAFGSARDNCRFMAKLQRHEFDIVNMPMSWLPYAMDELGYRLILSSEERYTAVLISLADHAVSRVEELRGKRVGVHSNTFTSLTILKRHRDMKPELVDSIEWRGREWEDLLLMDLLRGEIDALVTAGVLVQSLRPETQTRLSMVPLPSQLPLTFIAVRPGVNPDWVEQYQRVLSAHTFDAGRDLPGLTMRKPTADDLEMLNSFFSKAPPVLDCAE